MIRLVGGKYNGEGRVEIYHAGIWGTVCDDKWIQDNNNAIVVCKSLGFASGTAIKAESGFGEGSGHIWLDDVDCTGMEFCLEDCQHAGWGQTNCKHYEDIGVMCSGKYFNIRYFHYWKEQDIKQYIL